MQTIDELLRAAPSIEEKLDYSFKDRSRLLLAFVHRSFINENRQFQQHNERLEFLGDTVLNLAVSDFLYQQLPEAPEGDLSFLRSRLVDASTCVLFVHKLQVESFILLGKGERQNDGRGRETILADLFEAIVGAIYLDAGLEAAKRFLFDHFLEEIRNILKTPISNWKALLQDYCQKTFHETPLYEVVSESGPDHNKQYSVRVSIQGKELGIGEGNSKKIASQAAAASALARVEKG
jgi:ribonuclease-3